MGNFKITQSDQFSIEDLLKVEMDFKTMYNMEFPQEEYNIKLLKKMCLHLYNRLENIERKRK